MPSVKDLKKRITTVKNTQQTTRALKMVSAAKLRRAQEAIQNQRPYAKRISALIRELAMLSEAQGSTPAILKRPEVQDDSSGLKKVLLIVVTSDRGLCGGFNGNVIKMAQKWILKHQNQYQAEMSFVGRRGFDFFKSKKFKIGTHYQEAGGKVTFHKAKKLADSLVARYWNGEVDEVKVIYNEFKNAASQQVVVEDFLPVLADREEKSESQEVNSEALRPFIVKPNAQVLLEELMSKNFSIQAFRILLESQAGEHGARMSAMESATKNAGEMIRKLTLQFNKQRQAGITKELLEIISGSESQKG